MPGAPNLHAAQFNFNDHRDAAERLSPLLLAPQSSKMSKTSQVMVRSPTVNRCFVHYCPLLWVRNAVIAYNNGLWHSWYLCMYNEIEYSRYNVEGPSKLIAFCTAPHRTAPHRAAPFSALFTLIDFFFTKYYPL